MSTRAVRRAAQREARKARAKAAVTPPAVSFTPDPSTEFDALCQDLAQDEAKLDAIMAALAETETTHATAAQIAANQANSKRSTGPTSPEGKATVSQNRRSHGLTGCFQHLPGEDPQAFQELTDSVYAEYQPATDTEKRLAESLIQHYWRMQRAIRLQEQILLESVEYPGIDTKKLSLYLRYQTTHERSYYKAQRELQNLQKQKRKEQIGFESQTQVQEAHEARVRLAHAKALNMEVNAACRQTIEAPLPGLTKIPLQEIIGACRTAIATLAYDEQFKTAA